MIQILYEDNHIIVVNKQAGELVQGDSTGDTPLSEKVKQYLKKKYNKPGNIYLGVVHRIDRPTSGAIVFAKTSKALPRLNKLFKERQVDKTYWAIVANAPEPQQGKLVHYLKKNAKNNKSTSFIRPTDGAKEAITNYKFITSSDNYHLLEIDIETGRHHQIRAQLAAIGSPIKGDLKYGAPRSNKDGSISLHARSIKLVHPVKNEPLAIEAPPPNDVIWNYFLNFYKQL